MTAEQEEERDQARRAEFLLEATRELLAALEAERSRDPGDEVAENLCTIRLSAAQLQAQEVVRYLDRNKGFFSHTAVVRQTTAAAKAVATSRRGRR